MVDQRLQTLDRLIAEQKLQEAVLWGEQLCRDYAQSVPAHLSLSEAYRQQGRFRAAREQAATAYDLNPDDEFVRGQYARTLVPFADHQLILLLVSRQVSSSNPVGWSDEMLASAAASIDEWQQALILYDRILIQQPRQVNALYLRGLALSVLGRREEAITALKKLISWFPAYGRAWWSLADIDLAAVDEQLLTTLLTDKRLADTEKVYLWQVLGQLQQRRSAYADAFMCWENANKIRRAMLPDYQTRWDKLADTLLDNAQHHSINDSQATNASSVHNPVNLPECPIFIVGLPRSGSTLVEQMISNSGCVQALGELRDVEVLLQQAVGSDPVPLPFDLQPEVPESMVFDDFAASYYGRARSRCPTGRFSDKNPYNFLFLGIILQSFKHVRIVHVYKHPLDACLGTFKHQFAAAAPWSYSMTDITHFYQLYHRVMCAWQRLFPGRICHVSYEALLQNPEQESRRVFEYCDLEWNAQVMNLTLNTGAVLSASANQVREGVHTRAMFAHKKFEAQLQPFRQALLSKGLQPDRIWPFEV